MKLNTKIEWSNAEWWIHFYAYIALIIIIGSILAISVPAIIGHSWTRYNERTVGCIITVYWFDASMILFNNLFVWYGLWRFSSIRVHYLFLLMIGIGINLIVLSFECTLISDRTAPTWEMITLFFLTSLLLGGVCFSIFLVLKLVLYIKCLPKSEEEGLVMGIDGYYHPKTETELIALVKKANKEQLQIQCRDTVHSVAQFIYTNREKEQVPKPNKVSENISSNGSNINIMLDKLKKITWLDKKKGIVEVEAGINLGAGLGKSTLEENFLWKIWNEGDGWALEDFGRIRHQTISGFIKTGSTGGTLMYDLVDNIEAFQIIDGQGNIEWIEKNNSLFYAMGTSLGLMGIVTKIRFKLSPKYFIKGQEKTTLTTLNECQIDLFGPGTIGSAGKKEKPSLETFLKETAYTRIMWWPQKGSERIVTWSAHREEPFASFEPKPYHDFSNNGLFTKLKELGIAILYTILGSTNSVNISRNILHDFNRFRRILANQWTVIIGNFGGYFFSFLLTLILGIVAFLPIGIFAIFKFIPKWLLPKLINFIHPLTSNKNPLKEFEDYYYSSLPMDNTVGDVLMETTFTEIWLPLNRTQEVMNLLHKHYQEYEYTATGVFSNKLCVGNPSTFWMHPGYTNSIDEFKNGTIRVNLFWNTANARFPNEKGGYYDQFWKLFKDAGIPFRLHWGKCIPNYDFKDWAIYYRTNLPKMGDFLNLREQRDPNNVFLTSYWKTRLYGIKD